MINVFKATTYYFKENEKFFIYVALQLVILFDNQVLSEYFNVYDTQVDVLYALTKFGTRSNPSLRSNFIGPGVCCARDQEGPR